MKKAPFELFIGCTGPVYAYCNKAVMEYGDYKKIALVNAYTGEIHWKVKPENIPGQVLLRIEHDADAIASHLK